MNKNNEQFDQKNQSFDNKDTNIDMLEDDDEEEVFLTIASPTSAKNIKIK